MSYRLLAFSFLMFAWVLALPGNAAGPRPDDRPPIGVMGSRTYPKGSLMLTYRFTHMSMEPNYDGTQTLSTSEVLQKFPVAPTSMWMRMHMLGVMLGVTSRVTGMLTIPYVMKSMDHTTRVGREFSTSTDGIGDVKGLALIDIFGSEHHRAYGKIGLSFPTGSIDEEDDTPMGRVRLPYPMQNGSGTWDVLLGATYTGQVRRLSWGAQANGVIRPGENSNDYTLGDRYEVTAWLAHPWSSRVSTAFRLDWQQWFNISGADPTLNPLLVPTADPERRAGRRLDGLVSTNVAVRTGPLKGMRFAVEGGVPLYQDLVGPQLGGDWRITAGIQYMWMDLF